jgi:YegS/Rv2252/BmrU family lipid kinase
MESSEQQASTTQPSDIKKVFVVMNPVAGSTDADTVQEKIAEFCQQQGWECDIHSTCPEDDIRKLVREALAGGVDLVIASGGDGTVSAVVTGMASSGKPMGILPAGTGNMLARDLKIPLDLEEALALLRGPHKVQKIDAAKLGAEFYVLNVSVGLSSLVMRKTERKDKRRFGMLAYLWHGIKPVMKPDMHRFQMKVDGIEYRFSASEVMVTNTKLLGLDVASDEVNVDPSDGVLDLFVVSASTTADYVKVFSNFIVAQRPNGQAPLRYMRVKDHISIESEFPLPVQADGEEIGVTPLEMKLVPGALRIIVPESS